MQIYKYVYLYLNAMLFFGGMSREIDQIFGIFETATFFCKSMKPVIGARLLQSVVFRRRHTESQSRLQR